MSYYNEQMRKLLSRRAGDWLLIHRWPRTTAVVGIVLGLVAAYFSSAGLLSVGMRSLPLRFALNAACGYAVFVMFLGLWLLRMSPMPAKSLLDDGSDSIRTAIPGESAFDAVLDDSFEQAIKQGGRQADGVLGLALAIGALGLLFIGCHFVFHAPWYLGKLMVDGGKVRHRSVPPGRMRDFVVLPIGQSWPMAVLLVLHYTAVGAAMEMMVSRG